jgi:hypothetical protein
MFLPREYISGGGLSDRGIARESAVSVAVEDMSREDILSAAEAGSLTQEDLDKIEDFDPDLRAELDDITDAGREERIKPFLEYFKAGAKEALDGFEAGGEEREYFWDSFQNNVLESGGVRHTDVREHYLAGTAFEDVAQDVLQTALEDPDIYTIDIDKSGYYGRRSEGVVFSENTGTKQDQIDDPEGSGIPLEGLYAEDVREAVRLLENDNIYFEFSYVRRGGKKERTFKDFPIECFEHDLTVRYSESEDWRFEIRIDQDALLAKLSGVAEVEGEEDDVVYTYEGTNSTIGGASAKGHYVVALKPSQLAAEGAALGICVGRADMGYKRRLQDGQIKLYSVRTEAGKSKFCIEIAPRTSMTGRVLDKNEVAQVKGKANRIPGFTPEKPNLLTKPDEVRLVTEFLTEGLGMSREAVEKASDTRPGVLAMQTSGIDPFAPPLVKRRALKENPARSTPPIPVPPRVARLAEEAMSYPWGGQWGT